MAQMSFLCLALLQTGSVHEEFYKDCDLTVGGEVNVWGRRVVITDCDDFTKDYYRSKYGIGNLYCCVVDCFYSSVATNVYFFRQLENICLKIIFFFFSKTIY